jgi:polyisoprenoid-binding protein YceI
MLTRYQLNKSVRLHPMRVATLGVMAFATLPVLAQAPPTFKILTDQSKVSFKVSGSMEIVGTFKEWTSTVVFSTPDVTTGLLDIEIQAASVDTGSGVKNGKLKGKDFFNAAENPVIRFKSTKVIVTGPNEVELTGDFTIRGVTKPQVLKFAGTRNGQGGSVQGTMFFDRKDFGINGSIPFLKIADRVEVTVDLKLERTSGPPVVVKAP